MCVSAMHSGRGRKKMTKMKKLAWIGNYAIWEAESKYYVTLDCFIVNTFWTLECAQNWASMMSK